MPEQLKNKKCRPCEGKTGLLPAEDSRKLSQQIDRWHIIEDKSIEKTFKFNDFAHALAFVNKVGALAETENHHPEINLS